jgi:hypothetical protein
MLARLPVKVIAVSDVPSPVVKARPVVRLRLRLPLVIVRLTCRLLPPTSASLSTMGLPLAAEKVSEVLMGVLLGPGMVWMGASFWATTAMVMVAGSLVQPVPSERVRRRVRLRVDGASLVSR